MEKVIAYKASNGRLFESEEKCLAYEKKLSQYPKVKERIDVAEPSYVNGQYKNFDIIRHTTERWEKPSSQKKIEKYFIVGGKYKFIDLYGQHEETVMNGSLYINSESSTYWYHGFKHFAEQILLGNELTDDFVKSEVEKLNDNKVNKANGIIKLVVKVIKSGKKWEIDNPKWHSGAVAPYTFTMEKLD